MERRLERRIGCLELFLHTHELNEELRNKYVRYTVQLSWRAKTHLVHGRAFRAEHLEIDQLFVHPDGIQGEGGSP